MPVPRGKHPSQSGCPPRRSVSEEKDGKEESAAPGTPAPGKTGSNVPKSGLPTLVRPLSAEKVVSRLPRPPLPLPPPSEPRTLVKGDAAKLPGPPVAVSRPPPASPEPKKEPEQPSAHTPSIRPSRPRTGVMTAVDRIKPLLDKVRPALAPALDRCGALLGKASRALPAPALEWIRVRLDKVRGALPPGAQETLRRRPRLLAVVTIGGLLVVLGLLGLVVSLVGRLAGKSAESSRSAPSSETARTALVTSSAATGAQPASNAPCTEAGPARVVAPRAV